MTNNIEQLGKGAVKQPEDKRDFQAEIVLGAPVIDWEKEFRLPEPPNEHQGTSLSCVAQAWSYYHWQLKGKDYTRRSLYSRIYLPEGGAYLRDGGKALKAQGQSTRDEAIDPSPQTELGMRNRNGITYEMEASDIEKDYYGLGDNMDLLASAIKDYKGAVFGVTGSNSGWQDKTNPRPPWTNEETWGHALYAMGYHLHDGIKCIIAKSSWCSGSHREHHIKENYFTSGNTFDCWVLLGKEELMYEVKTVQQATKFGFLILEGKTGSIIFAGSKEEYETLGKVYNRVVLNPDGSFKPADIKIN